MFSVIFLVLYFKSYMLSAIYKLLQLKKSKSKIKNQKSKNSKSLTPRPN